MAEATDTSASSMANVDTPTCGRIDDDEDEDDENFEDAVSDLGHLALSPNCPVSPDSNDDFVDPGLPHFELLSDHGATSLQENDLPMDSTTCASSADHPEDSSCHSNGEHSHSTADVNYSSQSNDSFLGAHSNDEADTHAQAGTSGNSEPGRHGDELGSLGDGDEAGCHGNDEDDDGEETAESLVDDEEEQVKQMELLWSEEQKEVRFQ